MPLATPKMTYVVRQPYRLISAPASGPPTRVPVPMPATAKPSANVPRRSNQPPTTATIGTWPQATPIPTPIP